MVQFDTVRKPMDQPDAVDSDRAREIEEKIAELKRRWPAHSVPPRMWEELEELESELKQAEQDHAEEDDGR
jgi:hypothetical protein